MSRYTVRSVEKNDFPTLMSLEETMFGGCTEGVLGPYYVRLVCDFFTDTCFLIEVEGRPVGYLLAFVNQQRAYCTTLAIHPDYQGSRAIVALIRAFIAAIIDRVDECWFTVEEDNQAARALHRMLGATDSEVRDDFYGQGHPRIVSKIDRAGLDKAKKRFQRLGLLPNLQPVTSTESAAA